MTFSFLKTKLINFGAGKKIEYGTFTNSGVTTGGDISLSMRVVESIDLQYSGASVLATEAVVNETLPLKNGGVVTVVTVAGGDGYYCAVGK